MMIFLSHTATIVLADRTERCMIRYWHNAVVCPSVCLSVCLSVCDAVHCG